ncbi:hypothetical protein PY254_10440 [Rhodanobacter sp. AS-Z3]|uniref:hypothetical protein n=1 Tax=Rhodanobacter sp. AS-Z3 TaxID=3031330 RepID=UPI002479942B|nr:hypothetical protein [Rhodanobacter sp. AS-Z3]WEN13664.1 hypothetical protein PY254_10440 [Rhodanobacter sp. AS-Z3]
MKIEAYRCTWDDTGWMQYHDRTDPLPKKWDDAPPDETIALVAKIDADAEIARLRAALDKIAATTGSDDRWRCLVQIARDALRPNP